MVLWRRSPPAVAHTVSMTGTPTDRPWREAWEVSLYGAEGLFVRSAPAEHFRTSVALAPFADAVRRLAGRVDDALGRPDPFDLVDLGAGRGELLLGLGPVPRRWRLTAVERAPDPGVGLAWAAAVPSLTGLLIANEWLDNVPCDVLQDGRLVTVDSAGQEALGGFAGRESLDWQAKWWPGDGRVEVGLARDQAWSAAVGRVRRGVAVAVDYGHLRGSRRPTLTGFRHGRQVAPVPDGSGDLTAHVALDSCAAATGARLLRQREVLTELGVSAGLPTWTGDVTAYAAGLQHASQARTLLDPAGLGGFGWLVQAVGCADPLAGVSGRLST